MKKYNDGSVMEFRTCPKCSAKNWPSKSKIVGGPLILYCPECGAETIMKNNPQFNWAGWVALIFFAMFVAAVVSTIISPFLPE